MATMFPAEVEKFTTSGENTVYHFLRDVARPHEAFLVWYSPDIEDREPDFILLSPDCGLIVLEVKDWVVDQLLEMDPKSALLRIGNKEERRKQPLAQAREYVNSLMSMLGKKSPASGHGKLPCPITWGAVFPHISREEFNKTGLGKIMDAARVLCWDELADNSDLRKDVSGQKLRQWFIEHFPPLFPFSLTPAQVNWLRASIFPIVRLDLPRRSPILSGQAQTVLALDHEQENLARGFGPGKTLIIGPSGSGKTLILAHQAWNLPRADRKFKHILITCFNLSLVGYIRRLLVGKNISLGPDSVEVIPFYSLCERILGERLAHSNEETDYYDLIIRESLEHLDGSHPLQQHWDAILVDEGQDFSSDMAQVLLRLLPEHGSLVVAQDENQCLYQIADSGWQDMGIKGLKVRKLTRQYRNTRQISRLASHVLNLEQSNMEGAEGPEPGWLQSENAQDQIEDVADAIAKLCHQNTPMNEIAVLYTKSKAEGIDNVPERLVEAIEARGVLARWIARDTHSKRGFDITTDSVTVSTIYSVKGLDFAHVFLLGLDQLNPDSIRDKRLAYTAITRAREGLTLAVYKEDGLAAALRDKKKE